MRQLQLQQRHEKASSPKGRKRVETILHAARDLLIEEGYASLSMRKIAARCDMTVGNLSYYYSCKTDLLSDLVDAILQSYVGWWDEVMADDSLSPEQQFRTILTFIMDDLSEPETTGFFPELWALANHEAYAQEAMEYIYGEEQKMLSEMIGRLNSSLSEGDRKIVALHMLASMEGHTVFIGFRKKWHTHAKEARSIVVQSFMHMAKTITPADIYGVDGMT